MEQVDEVEPGQGQSGLLGFPARVDEEGTMQKVMERVDSSRNFFSDEAVTTQDELD